MSISAEEYKTQLQTLAERAEEIKKEIRCLDERQQQLVQTQSNAETAQHTASFSHHSVKINYLFAVFYGVTVAALLASVLYSVYWMKDPAVNTFFDGFRYNGMPLIMVIVAVVTAVIGTLFLLSRQKKLKTLAAEKASADAAFEEAKKEAEKGSRTVQAKKEELTALEKQRADLLARLYREHPEEKAKADAEKEAEKQRFLEELRKEEAFNARAAEEAKRKQELLVEGQKMFDHPQAYILDGQFSTEYEVFCTAAEYGCQDAQIRVVEILLGVTYKNGVKPDVKKGEELALRYGEEGSNAMYEILGKGFLYGEGAIEKDEAKGLRYLEKAAAKGREKAMIMAAVCHYNGVGTEKSEERARKFFEKAAKVGNAQAIQVLAAMDAGEKLRF